MSLFYEQLELLKDTSELACFYRDVQAQSDDIIGILLDFNEDWLLIDSIGTCDGSNNGLSILQTQELTQVRWLSESNKSLKTLMENNYKKTKTTNINIKSVETILASVQKQFGYVCIFLDDTKPDTCYIGKIIDIDTGKDSDAGCILFEEYPTHSSRDISKSLFKVDEITRVDAGAPYEEGVNMLANQYRKD